MYGHRELLKEIIMNTRMKVNDYIFNYKFNSKIIQKYLIIFISFIYKGYQILLISIPIQICSFLLPIDISKYLTIHKSKPKLLTENAPFLRAKIFHYFNLTKIIIERKKLSIETFTKS